MTITQDEDMEGLNPLAPRPEPVHVSGQAHKRLGDMARLWSGWPKGALHFKEMPDDRFAETDHEEQTIALDVDRLLLNPNRVLNSVTPFRLRQEAVLTGVLMHEAGHARYTKWVPHTEEEFEATKHNNGDPIEVDTLKFARIMEEPRVEYRVSTDADSMGASHLTWTMRAAAAHLLPPTQLSDNLGQRTLDLVESWLKRAGRAIAHCNGMGLTEPKWVGEFTNLVEEEVFNHLERVKEQTGKGNPMGDAAQVMNLLRAVVTYDEDEGVGLLDAARAILRLLFENDPNGQPQSSAAGACTGSPGDGTSEQEQDEANDGDGLSQALSDMEAKADVEEQAEGDKQAKTTPQPEEPKDPSSSERGGSAAGAGGQSLGQWRRPTAAERDLQRGAERVLRNAVDPTERRVESLSESPSATVDPASLAMWKAGGQVRDPMFFKRTRREVLPSPPVRVAILVDVSGSMDVMQEPSAVLSWALSSAALNLRNFAGRGTSVESCLIHWGSTARVLQSPGEVLRGIREVDCREGTNAMPQALELADDLMPGLLDNPDGKVRNTLVVQFTDWQHMGGMGFASQPTSPVQRLLRSGAKMLTIAPHDLGRGWGCSYDNVKDHPNTHAVVYNGNPEQVWDEASRMLRG